MFNFIKSQNKAIAKKIIVFKAVLFRTVNNYSENNNQNQKSVQKFISTKHSCSKKMSEIAKSSSTPATNNTESGELIKTGWLLKWTNYLKGYQKRWFVLSNGVLSYYRYVTQYIILFK